MKMDIEREMETIVLMLDDRDQEELVITVLGTSFVTPQGRQGFSFASFVAHLRPSKLYHWGK
jgi:hypothetical protein